MTITASFITCCARHNSADSRPDQRIPKGLIRGEKDRALCVCVGVCMCERQKEGERQRLTSTSYTFTSDQSSHLKAANSIHSLCSPPTVTRTHTHTSCPVPGLWQNEASLWINHKWESELAPWLQTFYDKKKNRKLLKQLFLFVTHISHSLLSQWH